MFRSVQPKKQADLIEQFVTSAGGTAKRTQVLELVAKLHGADNWNAFQGATRPKSTATISALLEKVQSSENELQALTAAMSTVSLHSGVERAVLEDVQRSLVRLQSLAKALEHRTWQAMGFNRELAAIPESFVALQLESVMFDEEAAWALTSSGADLDDTLMQAIMTQGVVALIEVRYPRADRYGVPEESTEEGAREWLWAEGFQVLQFLEAYGEDTGDDSMMRCRITIHVPASLEAAVKGIC